MILALAVSAGAASGAAAGSVELRYDPARQPAAPAFRSQSERDGIYRELAGFLTRLGERRLPPGRRLTIEILRVEPAGRFEPWRVDASDVRVLRDTTPPRITLRYVLREGRRLIVSGEEAVTNLNYLSDISARGSSDRLAYEKSMLKDWFHNRLIALRPQPR
jgi:hypothetical protein